MKERLILVLCLVAGASIVTTVNAFASTTKAQWKANTLNANNGFSTSKSILRQTGDNNLMLPTAFKPRRTHERLPVLFMSDSGGTERSRSTKKGVSTIVKDKTETKQKEQLKDEEQWRVLLHNDEVHTFQYVVQSLVKVIGTIDRKTAYEICVQTHNSGKGSVTKTWKKQAMKYCLGLQRQGLTASIAPDKNFKGGGKGNNDEGDGDGEE